MALKATLTKEEYDQLGDALKPEYAEKDEMYVLQAEGVEDVTGLKSALEKERSERKSLAKQIKDLTDKMGDLDPEEAKAAIAKLRELEDKQLMDEGKIDELVNKRVERMQADYDNQAKAFNKTIHDLKDSNTGLTSKLSEVLIDTALRDSAIKAGVKAAAIQDVILRGKQIWKLKDGAPLPEKDGQVVYGRDPNKPMSMDEWLGGLANEASHLFEPSGGGGATNQQRTGGGIRLTREQARDPHQYRQAKELAAKQGVEMQIVD